MYDCDNEDAEKCTGCRQLKALLDQMAKPNCEPVTIKSNLRESFAGALAHLKQEAAKNPGLEWHYSPPTIRRH